MAEKTVGWLELPFVEMEKPGGRQDGGMKVERRTGLFIWKCLA